jgi:transcriptional regulator of acetoin/glycerol metabolism
VLDERRVSPLGTEESHAVNFSWSASHRHLPTLVREGRFREDLYYRLAGIEVQLPALRDRSDKRKLIHCVLAAEGGADSSLSPEAERLLMEHAWPGNIRQLGHVLRIAAALASGKAITREHLPSMAPNAQPVHARHPTHAASGRQGGHDAAPAAAAEAAPDDAQDDYFPPPVKLNPIQANERQVLLQMLEQHRWNVSNVAKALDVSRNTLYRKLHKLHIRISHRTFDAGATVLRMRAVTTAERRTETAFTLRLVHHRLGPLPR